MQKYLYVSFKGIWRKCENLGKTETLRSYRVKFMDRTILKRKSKNWN